MSICKGDKNILFLVLSIKKTSIYICMGFQLMNTVIASYCCSEYQRYKLLKAIHNFQIKGYFSKKLQKKTMPHVLYYIFYYYCFHISKLLNVISVILIV